MVDGPLFMFSEPASFRDILNLSRKSSGTSSIRYIRVNSHSIDFEARCGFFAPGDRRLLNTYFVFFIFIFIGRRTDIDSLKLHQSVEQALQILHVCAPVLMAPLFRIIFRIEKLSNTLPTTETSTKTRTSTYKS